LSIWDHIKKSDRPIVPTGVELSADGRQIHFTWDDGRSTSVSARVLRQVCPCAQCVDEWTHQRTFDEEAVPSDIRIHDSRQIGNYALGLGFSDGHQTGIFHFRFLRETSEKSSASAPAS